MSIYYTGSKWNLDGVNETYPLYICKGQRGRGKTSHWLGELARRVLDEGHAPFVYLRRSEKELELSLKTGIFNGARQIPKYKTFFEKYPIETAKKGVVELTDGEGVPYVVAYYFSLNTVKGISNEESDVCLFDEYVAAKRSDYKGGDYGSNEPTLFLRLMETLFRNRKFSVIMLGNSDTPTNPYNEYFHIPYGAPVKKDRSTGVWYEEDYSEDFARFKQTETTLGKLMKGTAYEEYSLRNVSTYNVGDELIADKPKHAKLWCSLLFQKRVITLWTDNVTGLIYASDNYKADVNRRIYSVTNADMSVSTDFIKYSYEFVGALRSLYGQGAVRFNSQATAELFISILNI